MIGGITQTGEAGLESIPRRILTKGGPEALRAVRSQFLQQPGGQEVWDSQVRAFMTEEWEEAAKESFSNLGSPHRMKASQAARWYAKVWGSPKPRKRWAAALSPKQFKAMDKLMTVMRQTGAALYFGSETAERAKLMKQLENWVGSGAAAKARYLNPLTLVSDIGDFFLESHQAKNIEKLAKIITDEGEMSISR